jgi:aspartyl-tRNA(Asn)/glutamyl-tRNA(Gln) amidotransferase subunit A
VTAKTVDALKKVLDAIVGHDDKDGTSLPEEKCALVKSGVAEKPARVALAKSMTESADAEMQAKVARARAIFEEQGIAVVEIDDSLLMTAKAAWNILMSAELCNNVSRYDGVKYGYRTKNYKTIDELYTNSRTEAFGPLLKTAILFGSETLSTENYMKVYDKALRMRRVICERLAEIFSTFDAILLPVASKCSFTLADTAEKLTLAYDENLYTAPASISGMPVIAFGGVQLIGKAFSENTLYALAELFEKEGK